MVRLVDVVLKPGSRACPPLATLAAVPGCLSCALYPGYAGVEVPRDLHHSGGRQRVRWLLAIHSLHMTMPAVDAFLQWQVDPFATSQKIQPHIQ